MSENTTLVTKKTELMNSDEFNQALSDAAELKKEILTSCKNRNRNNFDRFYDIMVKSDKRVEDILDIKKRNRTDDDNNYLKTFKKNVSQTYKQVCDLITPEELEDGELSKVQKIVQKITTVLKMMSYIGYNDIENEFKKNGITLNYDKLDTNPVFANPTVKSNIADVFSIGKNIREDVNNNKEEIEDVIYTQSVPIDLQYDKQQNPIGIKPADFSKLVSLKTKILMAVSDEQKEKVGEVAENLAADYVFQNNRNDIMNKKILDLIPDQV